MTPDDLIQKAKFLHRLRSPDALIAELNRVDATTIDILRKKWQPQDRFQPVNLLRFLIAHKLSRREEITLETIDDIKNKITDRDISSIYDASESYVQSLRNYKNSPLGMFHQWKDPFKVLFPFFYSDLDKQSVNESLKNLGHEIIRQKSIPKAKIHAVDFYGSNNYGGDYAWLAIIPEDAPNVQRAYQLFLGFGQEGMKGGIYMGHRLNDKSFKELTYDIKGTDEFLARLDQSLPEWKKLNDTVDFTLQSDEREFKNRINKFEKEDLNVYFQVLDTLIAEINIANEYNLVFSVKSNQLSFHVGRRYCLVLKKDSFSFIAPEGYEIQNLQKGGFSGPENAVYYKNANRNMLFDHLPAIMNAVEVELSRDNQDDPKENDNSAFREAAFNHEYRSKFFDFVPNEIKPQIEHNMDQKIRNHLNTILFGPPGTGKTYNSVARSVAIADPMFYNNNSGNDAELKARFDSLLIKDFDSGHGQIAFCTFHQSFNYEDFVEGIKPHTTESSDANLRYEVKDGIFKKMCRLAEASREAAHFSKGNQGLLTNEEFEKGIFYKISLGDTTKEEGKEIYDFCMQNDVISIGFGGKNDFTSKSAREVERLVEKSNLDSFSTDAILRFKDGLKKGNYVVVSKGNNYIRAFGQVIGDYEYNPDEEIRHCHFRQVKWLFKDVDIPVSEMYEKKFSQQTIYKLKNNFIIPSFFVSSPEARIAQKDVKDFVLIIDEINRGNISSIFGELITLIEDNKRAGLPEALDVILPYSKERFSVPPNLYIIGTMNTADRSVEALDAALRRRFVFDELPPRYDLEKLKRKVAGFQLWEILEVINLRVEKLLDKDHKIGHSYFMFSDDSDPLVELIESFYNKIIPLLQEYFFGDFGKIGLVLGNGFVSVRNDSSKLFSEFDYGDAQMLLEKPIYEIIDYRKPSINRETTFEEAINILVNRRG